MSTSATPRYFHGTFASLEAGDVLRPGNEIGLTHHGRSAHVYGTTTAFDVEALDWPEQWDTPENRLGHAIDEAIEWAAHAADALCTNPMHVNAPNDDALFHYECVIEGDVPDCLRVYEIEPHGSVEQDPSSDPGPSAVMMGSARVLAEVGLASRPVAFLSLAP